LLLYLPLWFENSISSYLMYQCSRPGPAQQSARLTRSRPRHSETRYPIGQYIIAKLLIGQYIGNKLLIGQYISTELLIGQYNEPSFSLVNTPLQHLSVAAKASSNRSQPLILLKMQKVSSLWITNPFISLHILSITSLLSINPLIISDKNFIWYDVV
jgi:hypothetical protein